MAENVAVSKIAIEPFLQFEHRLNVSFVMKRQVNWGAVSPLLSTLWYGLIDVLPY